MLHGRWGPDNKDCPLCGTSGDKKVNPNNLNFAVSCPTCGSYNITMQAAYDVNSDDGPYCQRKYILSGVAREASERGSPISITTENMDQLLQSAAVPAGPLEAMNRLLLYVSRSRQTVAEFGEIQDRDYPVAFARNGAELQYYLHNLVSMAYLEHLPGTMVHFRPTPAGWQRVTELRKTEKDSDQAFVAMWFAPELGSIYEEGFKPALEAVGYQPVRIDLVQHNQKIDDRIVAEIRRSGLLVADFTGNRGGVYFEAGFAMGLGIPVIWTCHATEIEQVHFDTRQYNHITWTDATDLKQKLVDRIEATIPGRIRKSGAPAP